MKDAAVEAPIVRIEPRVSNRAARRERCSIAGTIRFCGVLLAQCVIKDMSTGGLRLYVPQTHWLPAEFEIEASLFDEPIKVQRVWANKEHVGVKLVGRNHR